MSPAITALFATANGAMEQAKTEEPRLAAEGSSTFHLTDRFYDSSLFLEAWKAPFQKWTFQKIAKSNFRCF